MKHLFAPYNLSLLAKEKGFNEPCLRYYNVGHNKDAPIRLSMFKNEQMGSVSAPLYQQLVDWLETTHRVLIVRFPYTSGKHKWDIWHWVNTSGDDGKWEAYKIHIETLNKALEEAFKLI